MLFQTIFFSFLDTNNSIRDVKCDASSNKRLPTNRGLCVPRNRSRRTKFRALLCLVEKKIWFNRKPIRLFTWKSINLLQFCVRFDFVRSHKFDAYAEVPLNPFIRMLWSWLQFGYSIISTLYVWHWDGNERLINYFGINTSSFIHCRPPVSEMNCWNIKWHAPTIGVLNSNRAQANVYIIFIVLFDFFPFMRFIREAEWLFDAFTNLAIK